MPIPRTTLEQWHVLRAVVEHGAFAKAADALNRSQSSISYALAGLQQALGVALLETRGRRSVLTETGRALLDEAMPLLDDMARLEARARALGAGGLARVRLVVDALYPRERLFRALHAVASERPGVEVELRETIRWSPTLAAGRDFNLAVVMAGPWTPGAERLQPIDLLAVAAPGHPLLAEPAPLDPARLTRHARVEIRGVEAVPPHGDLPGKVWEVGTIEAAVAAVRQGACHGWLPRHLVEADLADGRLRALPLGSASLRQVPLALCYGDGRNRDEPVLRRLAQLLARD